MIGALLRALFCKTTMFLGLDCSITRTDDVHVLRSDVVACRAALPGLTIVLSVRRNRTSKVLIRMVRQTILTTRCPMGIRLRRCVFKVNILRRMIRRRLLIFRFLRFVNVVIMAMFRANDLTTLTRFVMVITMNLRIFRYLKGKRVQDRSVLRANLLVNDGTLVPPFRNFHGITQDRFLIQRPINDIQEGRNRATLFRRLFRLLKDLTMRLAIVMINNLRANVTRVDRVLRGLIRIATILRRISCEVRLSNCFLFHHFQHHFHTITTTTYNRRKWTRYQRGRRVFSSRDAVFLRKVDQRPLRKYYNAGRHHRSPTRQWDLHNFHHRDYSAIQGPETASLH